MTVSEVKNLYEGQYACVEVYEAKTREIITQTTSIQIIVIN